MRSPLHEFAADNRYIMEAVARRAGIVDAVAIVLDEFHSPLLKAARRRGFLPLDGVFVRDWDPDERRTSAGMQFGVRLYDIEAIRFGHVHFPYDCGLDYYASDFFVVDRRGYRPVFRVGDHSCRDAARPSNP